MWRYYVHSTLTWYFPVCQSNQVINYYCDFLSSSSSTCWYLPTYFSVRNPYSLTYSNTHQSPLKYTAYHATLLQLNLSNLYGHRTMQTEGLGKMRMSLAELYIPEASATCIVSPDAWRIVKRLANFDSDHIYENWKIISILTTPSYNFTDIYSATLWR